MGCHKLNGLTQGFICVPNIYKYTFKKKDYYFEWHNYLGPTPVTKKDLVPWSGGRVPSGFYDMIEEWKTLTKEEQKQYLIWS